MNRTAPRTSGLFFLYIYHPLARHRKGPNDENGEGTPGISIKILGREPKAIARRILEATFIRSEKPSINGKEEDKLCAFMDCPFEIVTYFCSCFNYLLVQKNHL